MAKSKSTKKEDEAELRRNPINQFTCCDKSMDFKDFKQHLTDVHKLNKEQFKGKKSMLCHIDGDYWFSYNWQWELESGLKFTQYTMQVRAHDDMMRHG
jgi:hypothetical protein